MIEILPIKLLTDEDAPIFGNLSVALGKLSRFGLPVGQAFAVTPPNLKLKTVFEHHDFGTKEVFTQSLTLVEKEIRQIPVPEALSHELKKHKKFLLNSKEFKSIKNLWLALLSFWLDQIKHRLWNKGFYPGITEELDPQIVVAIKKIEGLCSSYFDPMQDDVAISIKSGKAHPADLKKIMELTELANKKLFIPHEYEWIIDDGVKLTGIKPYTPAVTGILPPIVLSCKASPCEAKSAVKVYFELSKGYAIERSDGVYIDSGKVFNPDKPKESFEDLAFKLVESATTFPDSPVLFKLADIPEDQGKVRGALRLLHQTSLFNPLISVLDFARHKKGLINIHIVIPYVRGVNELLQIKRELAVKNLARKNSLGIWLEVCVPENIINMESYFEAGIDGVVLNLDELISNLNGFDHQEGELAFYKQEVEGLIKFLGDGIKLLHKSKIPFIAYGSLTLNSKILEFLVEKGVYGIVVERYEAHSAYDLLRQIERKIVTHIHL